MTLPAWLLASPWLLPFPAVALLARRRPDLATQAPARGPAVSVIVPARNEAATIETVVRSVLASDYPDFELLVVDDRSTDGTAALVEALSPGDPRLRLIRGAELPAGWYGKPWACYQGYRAARGELLLFTDADTRHGPGLLARAVGMLGDSGADLVTVAPHQRCVTFWERVVMPQIWLLLALRFHPERVNRARRLRDVIANGQFVLVRRAGYEAVGTHAAVRAEVAEDLALAQAYWRAGRPMRFAFADRLMETRMYTGLSHLIEGWSKNLYLGGRRSFPDEPLLRALVPVVLAVALGFWLIPPAAWVASALGFWPAAAAPATIATAASVLFWALVSAGMGIPPWYGLCYPLGAGLGLYVLARSAWRGRRRVEWKGRIYGEEVNSA